MNVLLDDNSFWTPAARDRALRDLDPKIVSIFYDDIELKLNDPLLDREEVIHLPDRNEGYSRVLFLGTTGAGKTTLVRQLIGSDPKHDRFPSTSTAKTTVFDIEVILSSTPYRSVVSFLPRDKVRNYLAECLVAAVSAAADGAKDEDIARRLLEHSEQRFRLSYLLGTLSIKDDDDDEDDADEEAESDETEIPEIDTEERKRLEAKLRSYLDRVKLISETMRRELSGNLNLVVKSLTPSDEDAFLELIEDSLLDNEEAQSLIDDIEEDIETRFKILEDGKLETDRSGWPIRWLYTNEDRVIFVKTINRFSSNYAKNFGKLLTPLVQGLRVAGPFQPTWWEDQDIPKLVLMDTEGLGHTPNSASSLPTSVTRRFDSVDVILLVDSATQPMVAGAQAVLRNVAASGHESKLLQKEVRTYISKPRDWKPSKPSDEMCDAAINLVAQEFFTRLHKMVPDTLWLAYLKDWQHAYDLRGTGTGNGRKQDVRVIYNLAAPVPRAVPTPQASKFLDTIRAVFKEAAVAAGAEVL